MQNRKNIGEIIWCTNILFIHTSNRIKASSFQAHLHSLGICGFFFFKKELNPGFIVVNWSYQYIPAIFERSSSKDCRAKYILVFNLLEKKEETCFKHFV